jgi:hypothetical protein
MNEDNCFRSDSNTIFFFWIDFTTNSTVRYFGKPDIRDLSLFVKRQLNLSLSPFDSAIISTSSEATIFVFSIPADDSLLRNSPDLANSFRHLTLCHTSLHQSKYFPVVTTVCVEAHWLCKYANVSAGDFVIFERQKRHFWGLPLSGNWKSSS